jgi:nifR3 family TIM-barrel protein
MKNSFFDAIGKSAVSSVSEKIVALAPMAGFTDSAMRIISNRYGADYSVTEMVSARAVYYNDRKTYALAKIREGEGNVGIQIFGSEPDIMAFAAERLSNPEGSLPPKVIDINMGCPVNKIFSNGEGSALMRSPELIYKIVKATSGATALPVTVKLRAGISEGAKNAVECAKAAEEGGASLVAVHGRTRAQMYSGEADREIIKDVKLALKIPVLANGDISSGTDALSMLRKTGADGIMIGRAVIGNPFIFSEIKAALRGEVYTPPTLSERVETALAQLSLSIEDKGESIAVREARKQIAMYLRSFRGASAARAEINRANTYSDVERALMSVCRENNI